LVCREDFSPYSRRTKVLTTNLPGIGKLDIFG
jgi:hypothetical protein